MLKLDASKFHDDTLLIRGHLFTIKVGLVDQQRLRFYEDNPRIYSLVRSGDEAPTQDEIEEQLREMEHVRELEHDIKLNGGLIDPLVVKQLTAEVIEGNSRLAAYRSLAQKNPTQWSMVKCHVLPEEVDDSVIAILLGQYHLKGKKEWQPYEQAGFLYRRSKCGDDMQTLSEEMNIGMGTVKTYVKTYAFMVDNGDNRPTRWSHYLEFLKSTKIKKAREEIPTFEAKIVSMIKADQFQRAEDIRDKLPLICEQRKTLQKFAKGTLQFEDAYELAEAAGADNDALKRLEKFRKWLAMSETSSQIVMGPASALGNVKYELNQIASSIKSIQRKLPS